MFRVLMTKMDINNILKRKGKIKIIEQIDEKEGSRYSPRLFAVKINLNFYKENGDGISSRKYFYIDNEGEIKTKLKSLAGSLFHEFCHGLHDVSGTYVPKIDIIITTHKIQDAWEDDEELHTIACFEHDPICDHCFDLCQSLIKKEDFFPRYSHGSHNGAGEPDAKKMQKYYNCISASQKFMDWWRGYML
jgi:hypothetical protein